MSLKTEWPYTCNQCGHIHTSTRLDSVCLECSCPARTADEYNAPRAGGAE